MKKHVTIYPHEWVKFNGRTHSVPEDEWYVKLAQQLLPIIQTATLFQTEPIGCQKEVTLAVCCYFQDAIAQQGGWKQWTKDYTAHYGRPLPFYMLNTDRYLLDEINLEDVAWILWSRKSRLAQPHQPPVCYNPHDETLIALAQTLYQQLDQCFEEAPISDTPSDAYWPTHGNLFEQLSTPLPEITPLTKLTRDVEYCLTYSGGKSLIYLKDYKELYHLLTKVLQWKAEGTLLPDLQKATELVIYANAKGMLIAPGVAAYFRESHNPLYDAQRATEEGYRLLLEPGSCPFDLLKYGMQHGLLPDLQLPFTHGREMIEQDWDFLARYFLEEYYEGK